MTSGRRLGDPIDRERLEVRHVPALELGLDYGAWKAAAIRLRGITPTTCGKNASTAAIKKESGIVSTAVRGCRSFRHQGESATQENYNSSSLDTPREPHRINGRSGNDRRRVESSSVD